MGECSSVEEAEAAVVAMGLTEFDKNHQGNLILETDCARIRWALVEETCRSACFTSIADAKTIASSFANMEFSIVNKG